MYHLGEEANVGGIFTSRFLHTSRITGIFCDKLIHNTTLGTVTYFQDLISILPSLTWYYYFTLVFVFYLLHSLIKTETTVLQIHVCFFLTVKFYFNMYIHVHVYHIC